MILLLSTLQSCLTFCKVFLIVILLALSFLFLFRKDTTLGRQVWDQVQDNITSPVCIIKVTVIVLFIFPLCPYTYKAENHFIWRIQCNLMKTPNLVSAVISFCNSSMLYMQNSLYRLVSIYNFILFFHTCLYVCFPFESFKKSISVE